MKINMLPVQRRFRALACAAVAITLFGLPAGVAFARGHGGGHGGFHTGAAHASVAHSGLGSADMHSNGMNHARFVAGHSVRAARIISGRQAALGAGQRSSNLSHHFVTGHHHHIFFAFGYPYGHGYYPYYYDVCNRHSPYYDPFYCRQLYYRGY